MKQTIQDIFMGMGRLSEQDMRKAQEIQRRDGGQLGHIIAQKFLDETEMARTLADKFNLPMADPDRFPENMPVEKVSFDFLKQNCILPLSFDGKVMDIAVADPTSTDAVENLRATFDCEARLSVATYSQILGHINHLQASKDAVMQRLLEHCTFEEAEETTEAAHLKDLAQEKGIIQLANLIIENAIKEISSDIHIEPEEAYVRVRYRIDGILYERERLPVRTQAALSSRFKLLASMNIAERRLPQDGRIKGRYLGKEIDIRVSTLPTVYGESIVMRLLDKETAFISLEDLGYDQDFLRVYESLITRPFGMILMTGPTGSGKTTSLYASLDRINSPDKKIITIEEPVEYLLKGINQMQVKPKIGLTFANGLRHIVRQDPDIIMVGEIRDMETASIAIHAALTGHLLFSTLHTNDASSAITRLVDMGAENYLVASTLIGAVAQRLVRRVCGSCKTSYDVPRDAERELGPDTKVLWRGTGCDQCMQTGYRGRIAIFELLVIDDGLRDLIISNAPVRVIKEMAVSKGMRTLREDGLMKVRKGITTIDEVFRVTQVGL